MRRTADGRSAALARAQAQLAGRRGAAKTHGGALGGGGSSSGRLAIPVASERSALSGSSARAGRKEAEKESLAEPPRPHGLFLKQKPSVVGDAGPAGLRPAAGRSLSAASKGRSSCVLRKLEQIESKFRSRKAQLDVNLALSEEEELSWSKSSQGPQPRTGGSLRFLKRSPAPKENRTPSAPHLHTLIKNVPLGLGADRDSEDDDEGGILGISQKPDGLEGLLGVRLRGKPFQTSLISFPTKTPSPPSLGPSHPARRSLKGPSHRTLSPPSWNVLRLSGAASRLSSPSLRESGAGAISPKAGSGSPTGRSWSGRSNIRSLDELFSEGTDPHSSSSDFRVNVLSLDDLAPTVASQAEELEEAAGRPDKEPEVALRPIPTQSPFKVSPALETTAATLEEEDNLGASDISEQLSGGSAEGPPSRAESLVATEYSDDFEPSAAAAEETEGESSARESQASSNASVSFSPSDSASRAASPLAGNRNTQPPTRVTVKEAAVQTSSSSFAYHWLQTEAAATLGQTEGGSTVAAEPSIARHVVSWEAIEALTTYSPAALALNDLLKQNVLLIRQYVEASRQLHASIVAALEEEHFHYHTLDEAKAYIARHKPPPLTVEQALQELTEERSRAC